jgi:hypothetical protein
MLILILIAFGGMILLVQHESVDVVCLFKSVLIIGSDVFRQVICSVGPPRLRCPCFAIKALDVPHITGIYFCLCIGCQTVLLDLF